VLVVQRLPNNFNTGLGLGAVSVDGGFEDESGKAIENFQAKILNMPAPDRRVDPGGRTISTLGATAPAGPASDPAQGSSADWWHANQAGFANGNKVADLTPDFAAKVHWSTDGH